jgi:hypothetical protein
VIQIGAALRAEPFAVFSAHRPQGEGENHLLLDSLREIDFFSPEINKPDLVGIQLFLFRFGGFRCSRAVSGVSEREL